MREVRNGNIQSMESIKTTLPEFISLHKSYNAMISHISNVLHELKETTSQLNKTRESLIHTSEDTLDTTKQVVNAIQHVKQGAEQQQ